MSSDEGKSRRTQPPGTFRLGSIAGIDILVAHSWFLIVALVAILIAPQLQDVKPGLGWLAYVAGVAFAVLLYGSVLLHEISHALAARVFRMPVHAIHLHFLGGATEIEEQAPTPWREFVIAVVGPITSLAVGGLFYLVFTTLSPGLLKFVVVALAVMNLIVGLLNLVPGLPLDGGRVLQAIIWGVSRRRNLGVVVAAWGGRVAAAAALCYPLVLSALDRPIEIVDYLIAFLVAAFLWGGSTQALAMAKVKGKLPALNARRLARPAIGIPSDLPLSEGVRRANETNAGSLVTVTTDGYPTGVVNETAVIQTPQDRRPWMTCGDVARRIEDGLQLSADLGGEDLLRALQRTPATEYVLLEPDGTVYGVLVASDVDQAFRAA